MNKNKKRRFAPGQKIPKTYGRAGNISKEESDAMLEEALDQLFSAAHRSDPADRTKQPEKIPLPALEGDGEEVFGHSGERKRISSRTQDASLARDGVEQSQPIRENSQPQVAGGQKWQPRPMAKADVAAPHGNHRPQPVQPDTSQPAVPAVQNEEYLSPGYTQERPTLTSGERYAPPTPARFTQDPKRGCRERRRRNCQYKTAGIGTDTEGC